MMDMVPEQDRKLLEDICQTLFDKKGFNILCLDVRGLSSVSDYFVIAEGNVEKHVQALSQSVYEKMQLLGRMPLHLEGKRTGDWVVLDYTDVVIHLFIPDMREKYELEQLWDKASIIDVAIHQQHVG